MRPLRPITLKQTLKYRGPFVFLVGSLVDSDFKVFHGPLNSVPAWRLNDSLHQSAMGGAC
jgi:hypothetical protein